MLWALPSNGHCLQNHRLETDLYATVLRLECLFHTVTCLSDYRKGFRLLIGFIDHLQLLTTSNYSTLANSCTRLLTTAHAKSSQFVFPTRFLATDPNNVLCLLLYWLTDAPQLTKLKVKVKVKVMLRPTVPSASLSWNKAHIWGLRPDLYYCWTVAGLLMWSALSDERTGLSFARLSQQY
jgi:hypothetical protein